MVLWASINVWWDSSCSSAGRPIMPQCLQLHLSESLTGRSGLHLPLIQIACQRRLTFWAQWDVRDSGSACEAADGSQRCFSSASRHHQLCVQCCGETWNHYKTGGKRRRKRKGRNKEEDTEQVLVTVLQLLIPLPKIKLLTNKSLQCQQAQEGYSHLAEFEGWRARLNLFWVILTRDQICSLSEDKCSLSICSKFVQN